MTSKRFIASIILLALLGTTLLWTEEPTLPPKEESDSSKSATTIDPEKVEQAIQDIRKELGRDYGTGITPGVVTPRGQVAYEEPFVMAGNILPALFSRIKNGTISRCSQALYQDFFEKKPDYVIKVYLFKDAETYRGYCRKTCGEEPGTPFGFYSPSGKKLVMDISTGTGTLVHEMFHALVAPDFPNIPAWFNEGMGSLYEQCRIEPNSTTPGGVPPRGGSLRGLINWRYPTLKKAIIKEKLVKLADLLKMDDDTFYGRRSDLHYAEARYFCMYLQDQNVLPKFYKTFKVNYIKEKSDQAKPLVGIKTLTKLLDKSLDEIENEWKKWAIKLDQED